MVLDEMDAAVEPLIELGQPAIDDRDRQPGPLPELVVRDLRDGRARLLRKIGLQRQQVPPLALERVLVGEVQIEREDADVARAPPPPTGTASSPAMRKRRCRSTPAPQTSLSERESTNTVGPGSPPRRKPERVPLPPLQPEPP